MNSDNRNNQMTVQASASHNKKEASSLQTSNAPAQQHAQITPNNAIQQPAPIAQNTSTTSSVGEDATTTPPPSTSEVKLGYNSLGDGGRA